MKLVIDRKEWLHGKDSEGGSSFLLRESDEKKCCIGFYSLSKGHELSDIMNIRCPWDVKDWKGTGGIHLLERKDTKIYIAYHDLINANDAVAITDEYREAEIKRLFLELDGTEVEFVGEY